MNFKDYYQVLGVDRDASQQEIKKSFRQLALRYHPDRNPENSKQAEETFKRINEAYEVLGNEVRRRRYDYLTSQLERRQRVFVVDDLIKGKPWGCRRGYGRRCDTWPW